MKYMNQLSALDRAHAKRNNKPAAQGTRRNPVRLPAPANSLVERLLAARTLTLR